MKLRVLTFALLLSLFCLFSGCRERTVFHQYAATDVDGWDVTERVVFKVDTLHRKGIYQPTLHLRVTTGGEYPFQTIAIAVHQQWQAADSLVSERIDTLQCRLLTPTGHRLERGISLSQHAYALPPLQLPAGTVGRISIVHLMRKETIPGVTDVGFSLDVQP